MCLKSIGKGKPSTFELVLGGHRSNRVAQRHQRQVVVHVLGCAKTKIIQCGAQATVGAMRKDMGLPCGAVFLVPGHRELDDKMQLGEIVSEGHLTVEVRCRGVGGGDAEDAALRDAAGNPYVDEVRRLLVARANVHSTDALGNTALHRAALNGRLEASQMLLAEGADVDALNHSKFRSHHHTVSQTS